MNVDLVTTIAMIFNFLVLVFLLRRFLYKPILKVMDEREQKITRREAEAAEKARQAEAEAGRYREKESALREQEEKIMEQARVEAEAERRSLVEAARREIAETRRRWEEAFHREKESFVFELRRQVGRQAGLVARRCLSDLADANLHEMIWAVFMRKLQELPPGEAEKLGAALGRSEGRADLRGAFDLPGEKVAQLRDYLAEIAAGKIELQSGKEPGLICGLELEAGGYRVAWSVESYLAGVEEQILQALDRAERKEQSGLAGEETADG